MPSDRSLDRMVQEATFFPGLNIRLGSLNATLEIIEQQLEEARLSEITRIRAEHASLGDELHPDDRDADLFALKQQVMHLLPKTLRGGFLVTLWAVLERSVHDIAQAAASHTGHELAERAFHKPFFCAATEALSRFAKIDAFPDTTVAATLKDIQIIRNALVHHDGRQSELPEPLALMTPASLERLGWQVVRDFDFVYVVPGEEYLRTATQTVYSYVHSTARRVFDALVPE